jgi:FixJ family two-component response regulator
MDLPLRSGFGTSRTARTSTTKPLLAIVDDDASVGRAIARLVRQLGMNAEAFVSGRDLLDRFDNAPAFEPDCILLDIQMPDLSGYDVQEQLTRRQSRCPVILMTAYWDTDEQQHALSAVAVLFKPLDEQLFITAVRTALEQGARTRRTTDPFESLS